MNSDSIAWYVGGTARNQVASQTLASVTETLVLVNTDSGTTAALLKVPLQTDILGSGTPNQYHGINQAILMPQRGRSDPFTNVSAPYFTSDSFDGRPFQFQVVGVGSAAANAGNTLILAMYQGTSATIGSDNKIAANSALATASAASLNFIMTANIIWDSSSQSLGGYFNQVINYNGTSTYASHAALTDVTSLAAASSLSFGFSVKWGNAAGGTIAVKEMSINLI